MKITIRDESILIDGYVNAVERDSKVLSDRKGNFVEKIKAGAFQRSLDRAKRTSYDVKVLLNHDYQRELTNTKEATTQIREDAIGLRCTCEIRDKEVIEKARKGKLVGWSFGFIPIKDDWEEAEPKKREIRELELKEVSILDDSKIPAYNGTSIETRAEIMDDIIEIRMLNEEVETRTEPTEFDNYEYENRYLMTRA